MDIGNYTYHILCSEPQKIVESKITFDWTEKEFEDAGGED